MTLGQGQEMTLTLINYMYTSLTLFHQSNWLSYSKEIMASHTGVVGKQCKASLTPFGRSLM